MRDTDRILRGPSVLSIAGGTGQRRIASVLEADGFRMVGNGRSAEEVASRSSELSPDAVVVIDELHSEARERIEGVRRRFPRAKIVVVSAFATPVEVREALEHGVDGVVLDDEVEDCLALTVRVVCRGQIVLPGAFRRSVLKPALSTREKQVLAMVVMGFTNGEIARKLHVTESTVKSHLSSGFKKLGVGSRAEAAQAILDPGHGFGTGILAISDDVDSAV